MLAVADTIKSSKSDHFTSLVVALSTRELLDVAREVRISTDHLCNRHGIISHATSLDEVRLGRGPP